MVTHSKKGFFSRLWDKISLAEQPQDTRTVVLHNDPLGSTGTESYSGYPTEDYLYKMRGTERADIFDQMRRSDPQIKMILSAVKNVIRSAVWSIQPGDEEENSVKDAELIEHILFKDMDQTWTRFLNEALTCCEFGHSVFEKVHKVVKNHKKFGTYNGLQTLSFRSPRTIERWNLDRQTGKLLSVHQMAHGDLDKMVDIPAEFLLVFTLEKEGSNYEGISLLRPCYGSFYRKNQYLKWNAVGIEKFAVPTPLVKVPAGRENSQDFAALIAALQAYSTHQKGYLTYPDGYEIDLNSNTYDPQKVEVSIDNEDKRMVKAFLANFLELGMNGTGAYALSNDLSDFFLSGIEYIAAEIADEINHSLIPELIKMNRGPRDVYPQLTYSGIRDKAGKEIAEVLDLLVRSKIVVPDDALEIDVRKRFSLPKKSEEGQRDVTPPAPFAPGQKPGDDAEDKEEDTEEEDEKSLSERIRLAEKGRLAGLFDA